MDLKNPVSVDCAGKRLLGASCCGVRNAEVSLDALDDDVTLVPGELVRAGVVTTGCAVGWLSASVTLTSAVACCKRCS